MDIVRQDFLDAIERIRSGNPTNDALKLKVKQAMTEALSVPETAGISITGLQSAVRARHGIATPVVIVCSGFQ